VSLHWWAVTLARYPTQAASKPRKSCAYFRRPPEKNTPEKGLRGTRVGPFCFCSGRKSYLRSEPREKERKKVHERRKLAAAYAPSPLFPFSPMFPYAVVRSNVMTRLGSARFLSISSPPTSYTDHISFNSLERKKSWQESR
jgi:hypothetical protein